MLRPLPQTHQLLLVRIFRSKSPEEVLPSCDIIHLLLWEQQSFSEPLPPAPLGDKDTKPADIPKTLPEEASTDNAPPQLLPSPSRRFYCNLKTLQQFMSKHSATVGRTTPPSGPGSGSCDWLWVREGDRSLPLSLREVSDACIRKLETAQTAGFCLHHF